MSFNRSWHLVLYSVVFKMTVALPLSAGSIITLEYFLSVCKASLSSLVMLPGRGGVVVAFEYVDTF